MQQGDDDTSAGAAHGVTDGDGAAVHVDLGHIKLQLAGNCDGLGGKRLVGLDQVQILDGQAGLGHSLAGGGDGAGAHDLGIHAALAPGNDLKQRLQAILLHSFLGSQDDGGGAVVDAGSVGGGDALNLLIVVRGRHVGGLEGHLHLVQRAVVGVCERALQGAHLLQSGVTGIFVHLKLHSLLFLLDHDGNNFILETAGLDGGQGLLLGVVAKLVQLLTGDAPDVADVLCGGAHVVVVECVPQAVFNHGIHHFAIVHTSAPTSGGDGVRSRAHILGAAAHHHVSVAGKDGAGALDAGLQAGAADHAHGVGGHFEGDAGLHHTLTSHVLALCGAQDITKHHFIQPLTLDVTALQGFRHDDCAQFGSGDILQGSAKLAHGSTAGADNIYFAHNQLTSNKLLKSGVSIRYHGII